MKSTTIIYLRLLAVLLTLSLITIIRTHAAPPPQDADATLYIINDSEQTICYVYISPVTSDEWGDDWLGDDETITAGESRSFYLPSGQYNVLLADCEGHALLAERSITVSELHELRFNTCKVLNLDGVDLFRHAQYPEALQKFQEALACYQDIEDRAGAGDSLNNIGAIYYNLGQCRQALDYWEQALTIRREISDLAGEGESLNNIGTGYESLGQYQEALDYYHQALITFREIGDRAGEAVSLNNIGVIHYRLGQYEEALDYYHNALITLREIGDRAGEGGNLNNIGTIYGSLGQYQEALDYYQQALTIRLEIGDHRGVGESLNNVGAVRKSLRQYQEALDYYQQALTIRREIGDRVGEGESLNSIGGIYAGLGQYQEALDYYQQALTIRREIGDHRGVGETLNNIGAVRKSLGQYQHALDYCRQALTIHREIGDRAGEEASLNNIGGICEGGGQYQQALDYYQQALTIGREMGDREGEAISLNNIGTVYESLGNYQQALDHFHQALTIHRKIGDRAGEGTGLNNIGFIYAYLGQYQQALDYYHQALTIHREIGDLASEAASLNNIGTVHESLGQYQQASDYLQQALTIHREIGDREGEAVSLNNIGFIYDRLMKYQEALDYYQQALIISREIGDRAGEGSSLNNIGAVYKNLGRNKQALKYFKQAIAVFEAMRGEMNVEEFKSGFAGENISPYLWIIPLLIEMNRSTEAFHYVQRAKARTFLDQLGNVRITPRATDDPELLARDQELLGQIRALEAILAGRIDIASLDATTRDSPSPLTVKQRAEIQSRLQAAYREYEQLLTHIKLTNSQYASLRTVQASTLITVQQTLPPDVTLLEYYVTDDETYAFVVTQNDFQAVSISTTAQALNESIAWLRQFSSLEGVPQASQELYDLLFAPVREHIHTDSLYIAPHSVLHYLPFGALHDGEHYLVEDYTIGYIPSASLLQYVNVETQRSEDAEEALVLGNPTREDVTPLPFAEQESQAVADLFGVPAHIGEEATESVVWEAAPQARYVHLAAHGSFNPVAPQFSRLYLAPDGTHDGYLELHEVWNLRLDRASLVTLSACQTQLGDLSAGDELVGLSRAFIYAGTPSLVASLWSVEDESTAYLMEHFYGYLQDGMGKAEALRQAQSDTMKEYPSPYYWAPFTLIGDMGAVTTGKTVPPGIATLTGSPWLWIGGGIVLIALIGVGLRVRSRRK